MEETLIVEPTLSKNLIILAYHDWQNEKNLIGKVKLLIKRKDLFPFILEDSIERKIPTVISFFGEEELEFIKINEQLHRYPLYTGEMWLSEIIESEQYPKGSLINVNIRTSYGLVTDAEMSSITSKYNKRKDFDDEDEDYE